MDYSAHLEVALAAAQKAEAILLKYFGQLESWETKSDHSPVTIADREAELIIKETLSTAFPDHGFLGEEFGEANLDKEFVWVIDPIDGTKEFVRGNPLFGTLIGLLHNGEFVVGVSHMPIIHETMAAAKDKGATYNGKPTHVTSLTKLTDAYVVTGALRYFKTRGIEKNLLDFTDQIAAQRSYSNLWAYHLLAQGRADAVIESKTKIWDIAALICIIQEAGGLITDINGEPITLSSDSAIAANPILHPQVVTSFNAP